MQPITLLLFPLLLHTQDGSMMTKFEHNAHEDTDVEAGAAAVVTQPKLNANNPAPVAASTTTSDVPPAGAAPSGGGGGDNGNGIGGTAAAAPAAVMGGVHSSSWSVRELMRRAEALDRVRVTRAWSLNAALGAMSAASSSTQTSPSSTAAAVSIVQEVASSRSIELVLCGCAGSGHMPAVPPAGQQQQQREADGAGVGSGPPPRAGNNANGNRNVPLSGASSSVHGKWPSIMGSRHGPSSLSLITRSWHGKSRHHARGSHRAREAAAASGRYTADGGSNSRHGGLASAVKGVINNALWDIVGDVAAGLVRSEPATAVLAVRASIPVMSTATV